MTTGFSSDGDPLDHGEGMQAALGMDKSRAGAHKVDLRRWHWALCVLRETEEPKGEGVYLKVVSLENDIEEISRLNRRHQKKNARRESERQHQGTRQW